MMGRRATRVLVMLVLALPLPMQTVLAAPSLAIDISWTRPGVPGTFEPPAALRVGDAVSIELTITDANHRGCDILFLHLGTGAQMGAGHGNEIAGGGLSACPVWTFVLPTSEPGAIQVLATSEAYPDGELDQSLSLTAPIVNLELEAGGAPQPFTSTYPNASWAPIDFLGTATPAFGEALTFAMPPGATRACTYSINGDLQTTVGAQPANLETCASWNVTLPDLRPSVYWALPESPPLQTWVHIAGATRDAAIGSFQAGYALSGEVFFAGSGGEEFESSLPMVILPEATNPRYVLVGNEISVNPRVAQIADGSDCEYQLRRPDTPMGEFQEFTTSVAAGACEPISFDADQTGFFHVHVAVPGEGTTPSGARTFEVVEPMPEPDLDVESPEAGEPFDVASSLSAGVPSDYAFELAPGTTLMSETGTSEAESCGSGLLDFEALERSASGRCGAQDAGTFSLTVEYHDATGASRSRSVAITIPEAWADVVDIVGHSLEEHIRWLYESRIASGCADDRFCPNAPVTRGQMATFLSRALNLPPTSEDFFSDDESSSHEISINRVAAAGITSGCGTNRFCPNDPVTRGQMATFLSRALDLAPTSHDFFSDDESSTHEVSINRVAAAGIASGCGTSRFCPTASVTRAQMAAFLHRALT